MTKTTDPDQSSTSASDALAANPLGVVAGGLALGVIVGALLPRTDGEKKLLQPLGARLGTTAAAAFAAAKDAGRTEMEARGLTRETARDQVKTLLQNVGQAASGAMTAATKTAMPESMSAEPEAAPSETTVPASGDKPLNEPKTKVVAGDRETSVSAT